MGVFTQQLIFLLKVWLVKKVSTYYICFADTCYLFYFEVIHEKDKLAQHSEKISVPKVAKLRLFFCSNSSAQQYFSYIVFITKISAFGTIFFHYELVF